MIVGKTTLEVIEHSTSLFKSGHAAGRLGGHYSVGFLDGIVQDGGKIDVLWKDG